MNSLRIVLFAVLAGCSVPHSGLSFDDESDSGPGPDAPTDAPSDTLEDTNRPDTGVGDGCVPVTELCNGFDDDCDGIVDNGVPSEGPCGESEWCIAGTSECVGGRFVCQGQTGRSEEVCDGTLQDENCDGSVDEGCGCTVDTMCAFSTGVCTAGVARCIGGERGECEPVGATMEVCDGLDNNCDGSVDEGFPPRRTFYLDSDGDGFGDAAATIEACVAPSGYVETAGDCAPTNAAIFPGAPEACDGIDSDCSGDSEEVITYFADQDEDGFGVGPEMMTCDAAPEKTSDRGGDCDDTDPSINPGVAERCDGLDNNCGGGVDEGVCTACQRRTHDGHTYLFCDFAVNLNWGLARGGSIAGTAVGCSPFGYQLVTIESAAEHDWLFANAPRRRAWWIGLHEPDGSDEDRLEWTATGEEPTYTEPVTRFGSSSSEDCYVLRSDLTGRVWSDRRCGDSNAFICEVED